MININKLNKILYNDYGIILNESEISYLKYLNNISNKNTSIILKEFFTKCTTRHLCVENNKKKEGNKNKQFATKEEANVYKKNLENAFLVRQGAASRRFGGTY